MIPSTLLHRNHHLEQYIDSHTRHGQYEPLLPTVLTTAYYGLKQHSHTDKTILNRLQSKAMHRSQARENFAPPAPPTYALETATESFMQAASQLSNVGAGPLEQASKSQAVTVATVMQNDSKDYSVGPVDVGENAYLMHDPMDQPLATQGPQPLDAGVRASASKGQNTQRKSVGKRDTRRPWHDSGKTFGRLAGHTTSGEQLGLSMVGGGEDFTTQALKNQSVIRRNGLMLEHIMRQRGQQSAENQVLADLHQELRNIEKREGTYSYKGSTLMPGQRSEVKPAENKYLLVQVRRHIKE